MKKKICMVVPSFTAKGGITTVVNGYKGCSLLEEYDVNYIETYCEGNKLKKIIRAIYSYILFIRICMFNKPDIIHVHSSFGGSFYRKLPIITISHLFNIPVINHIHGSEIERLYINATDLKKRIVEKCFNKCAYLIVLSKEWKERLKVVSCNTPVEVVENYSVIQENCIHLKNNNIKTILFLGFITELKGCFDLPSIAEKVVKKDRNVKFVIAGSGEIEHLKELLRIKGIEQYFEFPGWVNNEEKSRLLKNANLFFLPSYTEAMPMSILEAMGYGLPIVSSNVGGIPQLVENGKNGFMCNPGDIDGFADAIIKMITNEDMIYEMGKVSYEIARENYSLEKHIHKLISLYRNVLGDD